MSFSKKLRELRSKKGLSQSAVAKLLFMTQQSYAKYENDLSTPNPEVLKKIAEIYGVSVDELLNNTAIPNYESIFPIKTKKLPLLGRIACGEPILAEEEYGEFVSVSEDVDADFCLRASGDSMINARIYDGDIVFIKSQPTVANGQIAAVIIGNEATLKRVYFYPEKNKLILNPENPKYEPMVFIGEELNDVRILGRAVAFQSLVF